jgi:hypothetical protein
MTTDKTEEIRQDTEIMVIEEKVPSLKTKIEALDVKDEPSSKLMTDYCGFIKDAIDKVETKRKFYVAPLNEAVKRLNNDAKSISGPLTELLRIGKEKIMSYLNAVRIKESAEAVAKQARIDEMSKKTGLPTVKVEVEEKRQVKSSIGAVHTTKRWTFEVIDFTKVPDDMKLVNEVKINNLIRAHTSTIKGVSSCDLEIAGVKIYQREDVSIRT